MKSMEIVHGLRVEPRSSWLPSTAVPGSRRAHSSPKMASRDSLHPRPRASGYWAFLCVSLDIEGLERIVVVRKYMRL